MKVRKKSDFPRCGESLLFHCLPERLRLNKRANRSQLYLSFLIRGYLIHPDLMVYIGLSLRKRLEFLAYFGKLPLPL